MDKYSSAFAHAMDRTGTKNTEVASLLGEDFSYSNVSLWRTGRRPIPVSHAPAIAALLGVAPEQISRGYAKLLQTESIRKAMKVGVSGAGPALAGHVMIERLEDFGSYEGNSRIALPEVIARRELGSASVENVRWVLQRSRSMEPGIKRQSIVLLDVERRDLADVLDGGTYAYRLWDRPDIRQITIQRETWTLMSTNKEIPSTQIGREDLHNLQILGAVIGVV